MGLKNKDESEIIDIDLKATKKQKFRINGDNDKILELNLSDMNIANRMQEGYKAITESMEQLAAIDTEDEDLSQKMKAIDMDIKNQIDYIFDSNVSEICGDGGNMYDPINGMFRFEYIIDTLTKLYESNLNSEFKKMKARIQKHTSKYTGK